MGKNKSGKPKAATFAEIIAEEKVAKLSPTNYNTMPPRWSFQWIDIGAAWCWTSMTAHESAKVHQRLGGFETMTWTEIQQKELGHPVDPEDPSLLKDAPSRLVEIGRGDFNLYSLRISGAGRVWGIKIEDVYYVLWWDPYHAIYPWEPPNT